MPQERRRVTLLTSLVLLSVIVGNAPAARAEVQDRFGVGLDVGVPAGVGVSLVARPASNLRLHAGIGHNYIAPGVQAGASLIAFPHSFISAALAIEGGRTFAGDANPLVRQVSGAPADEPALGDVRWDYLAARTGVELGSERMTFFVHVGVSLIRGEARHINQTRDSEMEGASSEPSIRVTDDRARFRIISPSAKVGFIVYL